MKLKVYEVLMTRGYQQLAWEQPDVASDARYSVFDARRKEGFWEPKPVKVVNPAAKRGDFFGFVPGSLVASRHSHEDLMHRPTFGNEVLPLGDDYLVCNVVNCVDCLDRQQSIPIIREGRIVGYENYVFRSHRVPTLDDPLFKIPETRETQIFVVHDSADPEYDLISCVKFHKAKGIQFRLVWTSDIESDEY